MQIRRATENDINGLQRLLRQVLMVHHNGRPDIFKGNTQKYTENELIDLIKDNSRPIFVCVDKDNYVLGYAFCILEQHLNSNILTDIKTLYIDDLCVDEEKRGQHIGKSLYEFVLEFAKAEGCYNVTLNVWSLNEGAIKFYESCGLKPLKIGMEKILH